MNGPLTSPSSPSLFLASTAPPPKLFCFASRPAYHAQVSRAVRNHDAGLFATPRQSPRDVQRAEELRARPARGAQRGCVCAHTRPKCTCYLAGLIGHGDIGSATSFSSCSCCAGRASSSTSSKVAASPDPSSMSMSPPVAPCMASSCASPECAQRSRRRLQSRFSSSRGS